MLQTPPYTDSASSDDGSKSQEDHLPSTNGSVNTPVPRAPFRGYDSDDRKVLFFDLHALITNSQADTELSELVPSSAGEPIDLDSGTMLITSLKDKNNGSRKVGFHVSPLHGDQDDVLLYTADGVLAVRIPTTRLNDSRAVIEHTITRLLTLADSTVPCPKAISWLPTQCEPWKSQTPPGVPIKICFIMTNNDEAVIRGSRIPNGILRNTYTVFRDDSVLFVVRSKSISTSRGGISRILGWVTVELRALRRGHTN